MDNKVFLDEAGLGEVGKVISKHYVKREEFDRDKKRKEVISSLAGNGDIYDNSVTNVMLLNGHYKIDLRNFIVNLDNTMVNKDDSDKYLYSLFEKNQFLDLGMGWLCVETNGRGTSCYVYQNIIDIATGITFSRRTKESREEYSEKWLLDNYGTEEFVKIDSLTLSQNWDSWVIMDGKSWSLPVHSGTLKEGYKSGLMIPDDKKKLDSIELEKIVKTDDIVNDLTAGGTDKALSAEQGKILFQYANEGKEKIANALIGKGVENVSKDSSFSDLAKGVDNVKTGYGVGDVIEVDNLEETTVDIPAKTIHSKLYAGDIVLSDRRLFDFYDNGVCFSTYSPANMRAFKVCRMNFDDDFSQAVIEKPLMRWESVAQLYCYDNNIFLLTTHSYLYQYDFNGMKIKEINIRTFERKADIKTYPYITTSAMDSQHNIYCGYTDGYIYKISPDGTIALIATLKTQRDTNLEIATLSILNDNTLHILGHNQTKDRTDYRWEHFSINLSTNEVTKFNNPLSNTTDMTLFSPCADSEFCLYFHLSQGEYPKNKLYLVKYDKNFNLIWKKEMPNLNYFLQFIADDYLYFHKDKKLTIFDKNLNLIWSFEDENEIANVVKIKDCVGLLLSVGMQTMFKQIKPPRKTKAYKILK